MLKGKNIFSIALIVVFILSLFLRFYKLSSYPVGFHVDEASKGYTAYSLLHTGKDDNNNFLPLYIDIFGDNSPSGYHFLDIIPVSLFGLTEFAVRFPGAFTGALSIFAIFLLSYSIFKDKKISLLSAFLLAISPWHINLSRASSESIVALFFILLGFASIIWSIHAQKIKFIIAGAFLLSISFLFYQTPRAFVPLLFFALVVLCFSIWKTKLNNRFKKIFICAFILLLAFDFALIFLISGGTGRFTQVNIFNHPETRLVLEEQIREDGVSQTSTFITRLFHNKITNYFLTYTYNYFEYFSLNFLFIKGLPAWYSIPNIGVFYLIEMPFILLGLGLLAFNKNKTYLILLIWLILGPAVAALTVDEHNLQRALVMYPVLEIIAAYGIIYSISKVKNNKKIMITILAILFFVNSSYFFHQYFIHTKVHQTWYRNNGFPKMIDLIKNNYNNYDYIVSTRSQGGYPLFLFYLKYDPKKYQLEESPKDKSYKGFGKFIFVPDICPFTSKNPLIPKRNKTIFIEDGSCKEVAILQKVPFEYVLREDGTKAFRIVYLQNNQILSAK